jgi:hypothetical protein
MMNIIVIQQKCIFFHRSFPEYVFLGYDNGSVSMMDGA